MRCRDFIAGSKEYNTADKYVAAPWLYRKFGMNKVPEHAVLNIAAQGFYRVFLNGQELTKGRMAPYISNPEQSIHYDVYTPTGLREGENILAFLLGNGFCNVQDNGLWDFEKSAFRSAPSVACELICDGTEFLTTREGFFTLPSRILYDDIRGGERVDGRVKHDPGFLAGGMPAIAAVDHGGRFVRNKAHPVRVLSEIVPERIQPSEGGFIYDFGKNIAGIVRLHIFGARGQRVDLRFGEILRDGTLDLTNLLFGERSDAEHFQHDVYICSGDGEEIYEPSFTYHGFRYVFVSGITEKQADAALLTAYELGSSFRSAGSFSCSDRTAVRLQEITRQSDRSNFVYFPTDCPHREKNGWTGDIALSCEQMLYNFACADDLAVWLGDFMRAQKEDGQLPGIVPTSGWGFAWGNGPAWDIAFIEVPYRILQFTGNEQPARSAASGIEKYLRYMADRREKNGLLSFGLGDWCEAGTISEDSYATPLAITDTLIGMDICAKAAHILSVAGHSCAAYKALLLRDELKTAFRHEFVKEKLVTCNTQTAHAMALAYGGYDDAERVGALARLKELIVRDGGHFRVGVLGGRVLFDILAELGEVDLAFRLIVQKSFPSYGYILECGATTLWEAFLEMEDEHNGEYRRKDGVPRMLSLNHHFWGFISGWFYKYIAGLRICSPVEVNIQPYFLENLTYAEGEHSFKKGNIGVRWERCEDKIKLFIRSKGVHGAVRLPKGYIFKEGDSERTYRNGDSFTVCNLKI